VAEAAPGAGGGHPAQAAPSPATLQDDFASAAAEFHVPVSVLLAVSYQETLWESHQGQPSATGNYNVMGLTQVVPADLLPGTAAQVDTAAPALHTLDAAAALIGQPAAALRTDPDQSVRGGAALLASYERTSIGKGALPTAPGRWYAAVAAYDRTADAAAAQQFADRVYATMQSGESRTTTDGQTVTLAAQPALVPDTSGTAAQGAGQSAQQPECPSGLACSFVPAGGQNFDVADRPTDGDPIRYIVIHSTEGSAASAIRSFRTGDQGAAHYVIAADGSVTQMVPTQDTGIHADNKTVNMHSIGVEHEGFAMADASWFSEQEYESSAALVGYLAARYSIPLDRAHILGGDDSPYALGTAAAVTSMHADPGTSWDWAQYLSLLGAPLSGNGQPVVGGTVTIAPPYDSAYEPTLTGCPNAPGSPVASCAPRPADFVYLHTGPSGSAPLLDDALLDSVGMPSGTTGGSDVSDKAGYGQTFVVAALAGDWTAIWYGGQKAWFYNPGGRYAFANSAPAQTLLVTPVGSTPIPVYGRAYPETSAYPAPLKALAATAEQQITPLPDYSILPGQAYTASAEVAGDYYSAGQAGSPGVEVIGDTEYYPIRFDHRIAFVMASDVQVIAAAAPPTGTYVPYGPTRVLDTLTGTGAPEGTVGPGRTVGLQLVTGLPGGLPATGVTAVALDVTVSGATAPGYVTAYPDGTARPETASLTFAAGRTVTDQVVAPVGADGQVDLYNFAGEVGLVADLTGYWTDAGSGARFVATGPTRVLDTRAGTGAPKAQVGPGGSVAVQVTGLPGGPAAAGTTAVVLNVTASGASADGSVTVYPDGQPRPTAGAGLSLARNRTVSDLLTVPVGADGKVDLYNAVGRVDLVADLDGYFTTTGAGSVLHTEGPVRIMDTRNRIGVRSGPIGPNATVALQVGAVAGVPLNATAVVLEVTAVAPSAPGLLTVYPDGRPEPAMADLDYAAGETVTNLVTVPVVDGRIDVSSSGGSVQATADLVGYYAAD
jgi:hypothetical protein